MSKIITVWGSPCSGKTTTAVKLALSIYQETKKKIIIVSCDDQTPSIPILFPHLKNPELFSVGNILKQPQITDKEILKNLIVDKRNKDIGYLCYSNSENKYSYPAYDEVKAFSLLSILKEIADYVLVDCTSSNDNILSVSALQKADFSISLVTPDIKSISFYISQTPLYFEPEYEKSKKLIVINNTENDVYAPIEETRNYFKKISVVIPYNKEIKLQVANGELQKGIPDRKYRQKLEQLKDMVMI